MNYPAQPLKRMAYTKEEVCQMLGGDLKVRTLERWIDAGYLAVVKIGEPGGKGTVRIRETAIEEMLIRFEIMGGMPAIDTEDENGEE